MKNCIIYLIRSSAQDVENFNKSIALVEKNLMPFVNNTDVIVFHESSFQVFKHLVKTNIPIIYQLIKFELPKYDKSILDKIPEYFPHPNADDVGHSAFGSPGFSLGYRHMCRFFAGAIYEEEVLSDYEYYLRLDTDSYILSPVGYDLFDCMKRNNSLYGYIEPGIQFDHPKVVEGLWETVYKHFNIGTNPDIVKKPYLDIPEGKMFYTNFEIGNINWFRTSKYKEFFEFIDSTGGIYTHRWGDAPIKYLGINLFMSPQHMLSVKGFIYQHGAVYNL